jgi:hypothetical protein
VTGYTGRQRVVKFLVEVSPDDFAKFPAEKEGER